MGNSGKLTCGIHPHQHIARIHELCTAFISKRKRELFLFSHPTQLKSSGISTKLNF